jgi:hypothetical protein
MQWTWAIFRWAFSLQEMGSEARRLMIHVYALNRCLAHIMSFGVHVVIPCLYFILLFHTVLLG